jgi:malonyl CoA-acyl carrier protein transacylase
MLTCCSQGAQTVGMAKDLVESVPKAKEYFDKASEILGYDLLKVLYSVLSVNDIDLPCHDT